MVNLAKFITGAPSPGGAGGEGAVPPSQGGVGSDTALPAGQQEPLQLFVDSFH